MNWNWKDNCYHSHHYFHHCQYHHQSTTMIQDPSVIKISCRSRDISRIIPFCWLAGLAFIQYHITVIYSQQRSLQKVSHFLPSVSTIASWRSFTILFNCPSSSIPTSVIESFIHYIEFWHNLFHFSLTYRPDLSTNLNNLNLPTKDIFYNSDFK